MAWISPIPGQACAGISGHVRYPIRIITYFSRPCLDFVSHGGGSQNAKWSVDPEGPILPPSSLLKVPLPPEHLEGT